MYKLLFIPHKMYENIVPQHINMYLQIFNTHFMRAKPTKFTHHTRTQKNKSNLYANLRRLNVFTEIKNSN